MRIRFAVTLDVQRHPKLVPVADGPEAPAIYDVSSAKIERADQWECPTCGSTRCPRAYCSFEDTGSSAAIRASRPPTGFTKWT